MNNSSIENNGKRRVANNLINQKSPYLLQHAYNPINWYSWGKEAFKKANDENKPIFLSIGYSTCHWCHVMAHESFEDEEVAELMNDVFVSIKVDREERPDIDQIFMNICQMLTGSGGWPLTILLTPDKKPFLAGTYFPKRSRFGRIGLIELIQKVKELWNTKKNDLLNTAEEITFSFQNLTIEAPGDKLSISTLKKAYNDLALQYDSKNGGFGSRPKFPTPHNLMFILRFCKSSGKKEALEMVEKTLQEMRKGGIYDHIGFGFHRYSTDSEFLIPHFEKMLYDQALLAIAYTEAYQATENQEYATTAKEILSYVLRDMTSSEGGFYSAEDADSEGIEGKFYVWSIKELEQNFTKEELEFLKKVFNVQKDGNYLEEATGHKNGSNIFHLKDSYETIAKEMNLATEQFKSKFDLIRERLFNLRSKKVHPYKDDKILTDWNGLMIAALAIASRVFSDSVYIEKAAKAFNFILSKLYKSDGRLLHRFRDGKAEIQAFLSDYAFLIWGLIEMYETSFNTFYLTTALDLNKILLDYFWDNSIGGFFFTADDSEKLLMRQKEIYDGALPSGNSIAMLNLIRLSYLTGNHELEEKAEILGRVFSEKIENLPLGYTQFLIAVDLAVGPSYTLVIAGDSATNDTKEMLENIKNKYIPNIVLIFRPTEVNPPKIDEFAKFIEYFDKMDNKATAYVCINKTCKPPTNNISKMLEYLNTKWDAN